MADVLYTNTTNRIQTRGGVLVAPGETRVVDDRFPEQASYDAYQTVQALLAIDALSDADVIAMHDASALMTEKKATLQQIANYVRGIEAENNIGTPGAQGFGVGICPQEVLGMSRMSGTTDIASNNYGNYQYSDGSVMCWIPAFFYKIGTGSNGLAVNVVDIKPRYAYATVEEANTAGYALHRAFYDGTEQPGFFVDKYEWSNNSGIASSIALGNPLSSVATHNGWGSLLSGLTTGDNIHEGAIKAAKTRGNNFFCGSLPIYSALALLSLAHGQAATSTTHCAWFLVNKNYPKGNNNNALKDADDLTTTFTSDGYLNCAKTGSGSPFAKTTHNGQNCGVADLNGNLWEVAIGLTCIAANKTITGATQGNPCAITAAVHGYTTGAIVMIASVVGMTQLNDRLYTITVTGANTFTLNGVDSSGYAAYSSGGTATTGLFYAAKPTKQMKDFTSGNTLVTSHWGASGVAEMMSSLTVNLETNAASNAVGQRFGSGANQTLSESTNGDYWTQTGFMLPKINGTSNSGTQLFGADYFYQCFRNELCPVVGGAWADGAGAGVWGLNLSYSRAYSYASVGARAGLYL